MVLSLDLTLESPEQLLKTPMPSSPQTNQIRISWGGSQTSVFLKISLGDFFVQPRLRIIDRY